MPTSSLLNFTLSVALIIAIGWLLVIGQSILLPILTAVIAVYVIVTASDALGRLPLMDKLPEAILRFAVLFIATAVIAIITTVVTLTVREISAGVPVYEANLERLLTGFASTFDLDTQAVIAEVRSVTIDRIQLRPLIIGALSSFTSVGTTVFLIVIYAAFLLAERGGFKRKVREAFATEGQAERVSEVIGDMNRNIGEYLTIKTLINLILGGLSLAMLLVMGVDFALFWAIGIALLNYIPYVGSFVGVVLPTVFSLAQFGSFQTSIILGVLLTTAQVFVGNYLEPRLIGRQLNLSPFVVIVSLVFWTSLWGVPGAILAIPMTSVLVIGLASFSQTRFLAVLMANQIESVPRRG